jgi:hypothetical protein
MTLTLSELLAHRSPDLDGITRHLDSLSHPERVRQIRALGRKAQRHLFEAVAGHYPIAWSHLVPPDRPPLAEVPHFGKNSLPALTHFQKVFCRPDDTDGSVDELWGYNRTRPMIERAVGPGYFIARPYEVDGELLVDYLEVPPRRPAGWPPIVSNRARLSRFVYYQTQDILRGVSAHVSVGRATKHGRPMNAWFILTREP